MTIKVSFICNWGLNSHQLLDIYSRQTPKGTGVWKNIKGISKIEDSDFVINLGSKINSKINKPIIQLRREPDFIEKFIPCDDAHTIFDYSDKTFHVSTWQLIGKTYDELVNLEYGKDKKISVIASNKWSHRVNFLKKIEKYNEINFFGRRYKNLGQFKDSGLLPYEYSIAIENSSQYNYFTEKINDCLLLWTKPIYWGCPNISEYFPEGSYDLIDIDSPESIIEFFKRDLPKNEIKLIGEARDLVINKYNIWEVIHKIIN